MGLSSGDSSREGRHGFRLGLIVVKLERGGSTTEHGFALDLAGTLLIWLGCLRGLRRKFHGLLLYGSSWQLRTAPTRITRLLDLNG